MSTQHQEQPAHQISYGTYVLIWAGLLILTGFTVAVAGIHLGNLNVFAALLIAMVKCSLVLLFFMHLKYENKLFGGLFFVCLCTLAVIIGVTFTDTLFR